MNGIVLWFNTKIGYGFIRNEAGDFFVHASKLTNCKVLETNDEVSFDANDSAKGPEAVNVVRGEVERDKSGTVHKFNEVKGYGMIVGDDEQTYFVHMDSVESENPVLFEGDRVQFRAVPVEGRTTKATRVIKIG